MGGSCDFKITNSLNYEKSYDRNLSVAPYLSLVRPCRKYDRERMEVVVIRGDESCGQECNHYSPEPKRFVHNCGTTI